MSFVVIIPARFASTRLPGKPLQDINGKPMIVHVLERARESGADRIIVATDHEDVARAVEAAGGEVCMTRADHQSGTERLAEVVEKCAFSDDTLIVNIQGDEPFIHKSQIDAVCHCFDDNTTQIATLGIPFKTLDALKNPNSPKIVVDNNGYAMYFSRSVIPFVRGKEESEWLNAYPFLKHIGIYAYKREVLSAITKLPMSSLEKAESLEQLRWLQNGYRIKVGLTDVETIGIDTPDDLVRAERFLAQLR